jgi:hypothetical protein
MRHVAIEEEETEIREKRERERECSVENEEKKSYHCARSVFPVFFYCDKISAESDLLHTERREKRKRGRERRGRERERGTKEKTRDFRNDSRKCAFDRERVCV